MNFTWALYEDSIPIQKRLFSN